MIKSQKPLPLDTPAWMDIAWYEYLLWTKNSWAVYDREGCRRAQGYIDSTGEHFTPHAAGWCGCFVHWVLQKTNQLYGTAFSTVAVNPSGSQNYATRKRYPGSICIRPRLTRAPYGAIVVLNTSAWQGHVGFFVNTVKVGKKRYVYLLAGNQKDKVCVQEFLAYRKNRKIFYQTRKGKVFTLKGFVLPREYEMENQGEKAFEYCAEGYWVEESIEK